MHKPRAFTLIELLVVIAIIVVLSALLIPAVAKARASAAHARCAAQLHDIGQMLQMYFGENHNTLPKLNMMPSLQPPLNSYPSLVQLLAPYDHGGTRVFPSSKHTEVSRADDSSNDGPPRIPYSQAATGRRRMHRRRLSGRTGCQALAGSPGPLAGRGRRPGLALHGQPGVRRSARCSESP